MSRRSGRGYNGNGRPRFDVSPTRLALIATMTLLIVLPMPALVTTLVPGLLPSGLLQLLAALGFCAAALLFGPRSLRPVRYVMSLDWGRLLEYLAAGLVAATMMIVLITVLDRNRSSLEFFVAPGDVSRIVAGDSASPFTVVINPHGVEGRFRVAVGSSEGAWSQEVELGGPAISIAIPIPWNEVDTIRLVDEGKGTVLRELSGMSAN